MSVCVCVCVCGWSCVDDFTHNDLSPSPSLPSQAGVLVKVDSNDDQSGADNGVFEECSSKWNEWMLRPFRSSHPWPLNQIMTTAFYFLMNRQPPKDDVPTQGVWGVIKRRHKQFVGQPVVLVIDTELEGWLLLIFSHQVRALKEWFWTESGKETNHTLYALLNMKLHPAAGWLSINPVSSKSNKTNLATTPKRNAGNVCFQNHRYIPTSRFYFAILRFFPPSGSTLCFMLLLLLLLLFKILLGLGTKTTVLAWGNMSWLKIPALVTTTDAGDVPRPHEKTPVFEFGCYFLSKISRKLSQGLLKSLFLCSLNNCDIVEIGKVCSRWYLDSATIGQSPLCLCAKLS